MVLAINIGNTNLAFGLKNGGSLLSCHIPIKKCSTLPQIELALHSFFDAHSIAAQLISGCIIASVVPEKNKPVMKAVLNQLNITPVFVTPSMDFDINLSRYDCSLIGTDRLLCCMAAYTSFRSPLIVYDLGTATTANIITEDGFFLGGAILPGITTGLMALTIHTAMLPDTVPVSSVPLIGRNTNECLLTGAFYGAAGFIDNYTQRLCRELDRKASVILTGGNALKVIPFLNTEVIYYPDLLFEGLFLLYTKLGKGA